MVFKPQMAFGFTMNSFWFRRTTSSTALTTCSSFEVPRVHGM